MCRFFNVEVFVLTCPVVAVVVPSPASTVAAMAMPIEPPMVRKRLKSSPPGHSYARLTAKHRRNNEARDANNKDDALSPEPLSKKAADRNYDPLGHDIGRENPRDLIRRRSECAHHVGQGDVDHRHVENDHLGRREVRRPRTEFCRQWRKLRSHRPALSEPLLVVSTVTVADAPSRNSGSPGCKLSETRTGKRWVTFTQFPLAFSGGRRE